MLHYCDKMVRITPMNQPKGPEATRLRQKRLHSLRALRVPEDGLLGSLSETHVRCGKPNCRCAKPGEEGHPRWLFTFMVQGQRHVESVPAEWVEELRRRLERGRAFKEAAGELFAANAELWVLERKQRGKKRKKRK